MFDSLSMNNLKYLSIFATIVLSSIVGAECWLFSPRYQPYYYPFPYTVPTSILSSTGTTSTSSITSSPYSSGGNYIGQSPIIGSNPAGYNYNWYNYQNYPNSGVLYPSTNNNNNNYVPTGSFSNSLVPLSTGFTGGIPTTSSLFSNTGSLLRSWWTRKFTKFGLLNSPTTSSIGSNQCNYGYWPNTGNTNSISCPSSNLCCYPLIIQTNVESSSRPSYSDSTTSSLATYTPNSYVYPPSLSSSSSQYGFKTASDYAPQASEHTDDVIDSNQSST